MSSRLLALRTINWRRLAGPRRMIVSGVMLLALAVGVLMAMRTLRPAAPAQIVPGQALAWEIARAATRSGEVQLASGAYVPGSQLLLYTRTTQTDRARVRTWMLMQLEPFAEQLAKLSSKEKLTWIVDFGQGTVEQEVLTAALSKAADPSGYAYVSAAPGMLGSAAASLPVPQPAAAEPTAAPAAQPPADKPADKPADQAAAEPTPAPAAQAPAPQPTAAAPAANPPAAATGEPLVTTGFDDAGSQKSAWQPLSGDWLAHDGIYSQRDNAGYDFISMLNAAPQTHYQVQAKIQLGEGDMGGGFVYNVPDINTRNNAQIIDFDNKGGFLRWGRYNETGAYVYEGGVKVDPPINDGKWHDLKLTTHADASVVALDGKEIGRIKNKSTAGHVGLVSSKTKMDYDDVKLTVLEGAGAAPAPTAAPAQPAPTAQPEAPAASVDNFADDFGDGDTKGWQVLSGTWQNIDGAYQQTSVSGSDLGSISPFQSDAFSATVRLKRLDGDMGGGLYFNMAQPDKKSRSQMINYTQGGKAIQWGHFDEGGNFVFEGSAPVPDGNDGKWHTLSLRMTGGKASFMLDGKELAKDVKMTYTSGYIGLLVSNSKVAFDDITFTKQ